MLRGKQPSRVAIKPTATSEIPFNVSIDLFKVASGQSKDAMLNLALGLSGANSEPVRVQLKLKPSFMIGGSAVSIPGYITVGKEFKAAQ
jgi:hypothetical protein